MDKIGDRTYALMVDRIAESEGKVDQLAGLNADLMLANKALRVENERLKAICFDHELNFGAAEEEINRLTARVAELRGLCNWAAGRLLDAEDVVGYEKVMRALEKQP